MCTSVWIHSGCTVLKRNPDKVTRQPGIEPGQTRSGQGSANRLTRVTSTRKAIGSRHKMKSAATCQGPLTGAGSTTAGGNASVVITLKSAIPAVFSRPPLLHSHLAPPHLQTPGACPLPLPGLPRRLPGFPCVSALHGFFSKCRAPPHCLQVTQRSQSTSGTTAVRESGGAFAAVWCGFPQCGTSTLERSRRALHSRPGSQLDGTSPRVLSLRPYSPSSFRSGAMFFDSLVADVGGGLPDKRHA